MSFWKVAPVTRGDDLLIGPLESHPLGILDLKSGKIRALLDQQAADVYNGIYAHQIAGGNLGLYDLNSRKLQAQAAFPHFDDRGYLSAMASPDLNWLAARPGAIWDLASGRMIYHVRPFVGGSFDGESAFYADSPAYRGAPQTLVKLGLVKRGITPERKIEAPQALQYGFYQVVAEPHQTRELQGLFHPCHWEYPDFDPMDCDVTYEIRDMRNGKLLWTRHFAAETPRFHWEPRQGRVAISWQAIDRAVSGEIKNQPELASEWATARKRPGEAFVEVLDISNGSVRHAMFVDGALDAEFFAVGPHLLVAHPGYIEVFRLATGAKEGEIPGRPSALSPSGDFIAVGGDEPNKLEIFDLRFRRRLQQIAFSSNVDFDQFSTDGKRLLVLTRDQTAYILDVNDHTASPSPSDSAN